MKRLFMVVALSGLCSFALADGERNGVQLFYRMIGGQSNGPFPLKTRSVAAQDGAARTGSTGMADCGFTEYPFCSGFWSFSFRPKWGLFPRFAGHVPIDPDRVNTCDIVLDWVYEPDGCVWGPACKEFGQTFVATGEELVSVTLLVASKRQTFNLAVHRDGPDGEEIAPRKTFVSGQSMEYGNVAWAPGEVLLEIGERYYIRMWNDDGQAWNPYFHGEGDCYDAGMAYCDGQARTASDLALWIVNEPHDVWRAIVVDADADGWVRGAGGFSFVARTPNVRMITVDVKPVSSFCKNIVAYVWRTPARRKLLCGPRYNDACARADSAYEVSFLYGPDDLPTTPGEQYYVEVFAVPFAEGKPPVIPKERPDAPKLDLKATVFGETSTTPLPVISNVDVEFAGGEKAVISWRISKPAHVLLENRREDGTVARHIAQPLEQRIELSGLGAGTDCDFRLLAFDEAADISAPGTRVWRTPWYRARAPGGEPAQLRWPETPEYFVPLGPRPSTTIARDDPFVDAETVPLEGADFEDGLKGWQESKATAGSVCGTTDGISPTSGQYMYGWSLKAGEDRQQVFAENVIRQTVATKKGKWYAVVVDAITEVVNGPRGDTRIRLAADARGGDDLKGANSSQWFWTDGRWMTLTHQFQGEGDEATIAVGFFRWRDLDRATAFVDNVRIVEVKKKVGLEAILKKAGGMVWGPAMICLLVGTGVYLTIRTRLVQFTHIGHAVACIRGKYDHLQDAGDISHFRALTTALAATIGTGNIAGVATAIVMGGPGAIFWMWVTALVGMATKFASCSLAVHFREIHEDGSASGGPMYYLEKGFRPGWLVGLSGEENARWIAKVLAIMFALFAVVASFGIGNMVQANSVVGGLAYILPKTWQAGGFDIWVPGIDWSFTITWFSLAVGVVLFFFAGLVIVGGIKRIGSVTSLLVPLMSVFYVVGSICVLAMYIDKIPSCLSLIVREAFDFRSVAGGSIGMLIAMRYGVARGVFSNESGLGSAPMAHAAAKTPEMIREGFVAMLGPLIDTLIICTMTALVILVTQARASDPELDGSSLTAHAFEIGLFGYGQYVVGIGLALFAYSTIISWSYYGDRCAEYLFGPRAVRFYRYLYLLLIVVGAVGGLRVIWALADIFNALMAIPNLIGLVALAGLVAAKKRNYVKRLNAGEFAENQDR